MLCGREGEEFELINGGILSQEIRVKYFRAIADSVAIRMVAWHTLADRRAWDRLPAGENCCLADEFSRKSPYRNVSFYYLVGPTRH